MISGKTAPIFGGAAWAEVLSAHTDKSATAIIFFMVSLVILDGVILDYP
jgi:hypothetical protein